jgi:hypothetical protein
MSSLMLIRSAVDRQDGRRSLFRPSFLGTNCVMVGVRRLLHRLLELLVLGVSVPAVGGQGGVQERRVWIENLIVGRIVQTSICLGGS